VALLFFFPGEEARFLGGRERVGASGRDRLLHDFLVKSRSLCCCNRAGGRRQIEGGGREREWKRRDTNVCMFFFTKANVFIQQLSSID